MIPTIPEILRRGMRAPSVGAEAFAATGEATLLPAAEKSYVVSGVTICLVRAEVAELADAPDSKSGSLRGVWVRFPPSALAGRGACARGRRSWGNPCGRQRAASGLGLTDG